MTSPNTKRMFARVALTSLTEWAATASETMMTLKLSIMASRAVDSQQTFAKSPAITTVSIPRLRSSDSRSDEPAMKALAEMGLGDTVRLASFDLSAGFLKGIAAGQATFAIDQQQYLQGYLPVAFLALNARFGLMPGGNVPSGPNLITKDKAGQVIELSAKGIR